MKKNVMTGRWVPIMVVVAAVVWWGIRPSEINSSSLMTRIQMVERMGQALCILDSYCRESPLKSSCLSLAYSDLPGDLSDPMKTVLGLGLISGYPDKTFHPTESLVLGELLGSWVQLVRFVNGFLKCPSPAIYPDLTQWGITNQHWFYDDLQILTAIGALTDKSLYGLDLERPASDLEVRDLFRATVEYFSRDLVIFQTQPQSWKIAFKGCEKPISGTDWKFRIGLEGNLTPLPETGEITFPGFDVQQIVLENPAFDSVQIDLTDRSAPYRLIPLKEPKKDKKLAQEKPLQTTREKRTSPQLLHRQEDPTTPITPAVTGIILDALTKTPISSANVLVDGVLVVTNPTGKFSFLQKKKDHLSEVFVSAEGYQSLSLKHKIGFKNREMKVLLKPYRSLVKIRVISSATGLPVSGASLTFNGETATSGEKAIFELKNMKPGYHQIELKANGFQEGKELIFVEESPSLRTIKLHPSHLADSRKG